MRRALHIMAQTLFTVCCGKKNYLSVLWSLTESNALFYNVECGTVRLACLWKRNEYEQF